MNKRGNKQNEERRREETQTARRVDRIKNEERLIGTLLFDFPNNPSESIKLILAHAPESFEEPRQGMVAAAMHRLIGRPIDIGSVIAEIKSNGEGLDQEYLTTLWSAHVDIGLAESYADQLYTEFRSRKWVDSFRYAADTIETQPHSAFVVVKGLKQTLDYLESSARPGDLPAIIDAETLTASAPETPPELITGLLHVGSKLILGGGSKSHKTWSLLDLGLSVAYGEPWLSINTTAGRVLYVNFELPEWSINKRLNSVTEAKGIHREFGKIDFWNLRGLAASYEVLMPQIIARASQQPYALIILDPIYKLYGRLKENLAEDMGVLMNSIDSLTVRTGAAVAFGAHFSKGNQSNKESMDRISGSGVFARDADSLLIMTAHEEDDAFTIDSTLRNLGPQTQFAVRWQFPLLRRDDTLDPAKLKKIPGRARRFTEEMALEALGTGGLTSEQWQKACEDEYQISETAFHRLRRSIQGKKATKDIQGKWSPI